MIDELNDYWTVSNKKLYSGDAYFRDHSVDVREFYKLAFKVSLVATLSIFAIGVLVCLI